MRVLALGSNGSGQLGIGHTDDVDIPTPCLLPADLEPHESITQLAAGGNHTVLLTTAGRVLAAGSNESGRCGLPKSLAHSTTFHPVELVERDSIHKAQITHVAATWEASICVVDHRRAYTCGRGSKGELGVGKSSTILSDPTLIFDLSKLVGEGETISCIRASMSHVVFSTNTGRIFGWGSCRKGQLGESLREQKVAWTVQEINTPSPVRMIATGRDFTFIVGEKGEFAILGDDKHLKEAPRAITVDSIDQLECGWSNISLRMDHLLVGFGRNNHNQLPPSDLPPMSALATGSEHSLALTTNNKLLAWGWGEHGNCGHPSNAPKSPENRWNAIDVALNQGECVSFLGAGCATSFIVLTA